MSHKLNAHLNDKEMIPLWAFIEISQYILKTQQKNHF